MFESSYPKVFIAPSSPSLVSFLEKSKSKDSYISLRHLKMCAGDFCYFFNKYYKKYLENVEVKFVKVEVFTFKHFVSISIIYI